MLTVSHILLYQSLYSATATTDLVITKTTVITTTPATTIATTTIATTTAAVAAAVDISTTTFYSALCTRLAIA